MVALPSAICASATQLPLTQGLGFSHFPGTCPPLPRRLISTWMPIPSCPTAACPQARPHQTLALGCTGGQMVSLDHSGGSGPSVSPFSSSVWCSAHAEEGI